MSDSANVGNGPASSQGVRDEKRSFFWDKPQESKEIDMDTLLELNKSIERQENTKLARENHYWALLFWDRLIMTMAFHNPTCDCEQCIQPAV